MVVTVFAVAAGDAAIMHPTWSPDGTRIAFTSVDRPEVSEDGMPVESDIWVIDADGMILMPLYQPQGDEGVFLMTEIG